MGEISATPVGAIHPELALSTRYELMGRLGVGGMAELYLARAVGIGDFEKVVVLKRILAARAQDHDFVRMFEDEARVAAQLEHPNIVTTHDIGRDGDDVFFTMEYLHGENVKRLLAGTKQEGQLLPVELALQIGIGCAAGLHHAHEQRAYSGEPLDIVHRDVSPSNIIVTYQSGVKLIDFGIAKAASAKHVTEVGVVKGKASYMAPEQCRAENVDRRSDVFSLGIVLYEMLTMQRPFVAPEPLAVLAKIVNEEPVPPSRLRAGLPPALERVVMRALAKKPDDRYESAFALQEDLELVTREHRLHALPGALGRYLEHLFGPKPYPWAQHYRVSAPPLPAWSRPREPDSFVTTPRQRIDEGVTPSSERAEPVTEPSRIAGTVGAATEGGDVAAVREPPTRPPESGARVEPVRAAVDEPLPRPRRGGVLVLGAAAAIAVVVIAGWPSSERSLPSERAPAAAGLVATPAAIEATVAAEPSPTPQAFAATPVPVPAPTIDVAAVVEEPSAPPVASVDTEPEPPASRPSPSRAEKREADAQRKKDAAKLVAEAQSTWYNDPKRAQELARKALALHPTQEGWKVLGVASCRVGDRATALRARAKLSERWQSALDQACSSRGIELVPPT